MDRNNPSENPTKGREADDARDLLPLVYDELHDLAARFLARERPDHTLQATALVHEAYLRLQGRPGVGALDRHRFLTMAARTIRRILIDHARRHRSSLRRVERLKIELSEASRDGDEALDLLALDDALSRFAALDPRKSRLVELRFFGGLTVAEAAEVLSISPRVAADDWTVARAWLHRELTRGLGVEQS